MAKRTKEIALIGLLTAMITITGLFKIPGLIPGTEFQLSAPVAVGIAAAFGFRRYLISGVLASLVSLALGFQNLLNIAVAMSFRIAAGGLILLLGNSALIVILAGPLGTFLARLLLALITQTNVWVLTAAAAPGMVYTAIAAVPAYRMLVFLANASGFPEFLAPRRRLFRRFHQQKRRRSHGTIQSENACQPAGKRPVDPHLRRGEDRTGRNGGNRFR